MIFLYPLIILLQKLVYPRYAYTYITFPFGPGSGYSLMALTLFGSILIYLSRIQYLSQSTYYISYLYFYGAIIRSASLSFYSTKWIYQIYSLYISKYIRILSIYRSVYILIYSLSSKSTQSQSIIGVFVSLNGIIRYSYRLSYNLNIIFYLSPSFIYIIWKAILRLSFINQFLLQSLSFSLLILSNRY